jgi:hypothetical protein
MGVVSTACVVACYVEMARAMRMVPDEAYTVDLGLLSLLVSGLSQGLETL